MDMLGECAGATRRQELGPDAASNAGDTPSELHQDGGEEARSTRPGRELESDLRARAVSGDRSRSRLRIRGRREGPWLLRMGAAAAALLAVLAAGIAHAAAAPAAPTSHGAASLRSGHSWWLPSGQRGSVHGGSSLTVSGLLFDTSRSLTVSFSGYNREIVPNAFSNTPITVSATAVPHSTSEMVVQVPAYPGHESNVTVEVRDSRGAAVSLALAAGRSQTFEYLAEWSTLQGGFPSIWNPPSQFAASFWGAAASGLCYPQGDVRCSSPMSGGTSITLVGDGFQRGVCPEEDFCGDVTYALELEHAAQPGVLVRSEYVVPLDGNTLVFTLPASSLPAGELTVSLVRGGGGATRVPPASPPAITYMEEFRAAVANGAGRLDGVGGALTVLGAGFSASEEYWCVLSRDNATGHSWLAEERMYVQASYGGPGQLSCDPSHLALLHGHTPQVPRLSLARTGLTADEFFASTWVEDARGWGGLYPNAGGVRVSVVRVGGFISARVGVVALGEAPQLRDGAFVPLAMPHGAALPLLHDTNARGAWYASNVTAAPAIGGTPMELEVAALSPTEQGDFVLVGASVNGTSLATLEVSPGGAGPNGIMFQIFAKRNASLTGFEIASGGNVTQTVWVYMREGEFHGHELGAPAREGWALVNAGGTVVSTRGASRTAVLSLAPVALRAGRTYAFALVGSEGVSYASSPPPDLNVSGCCGALQQHRMDCCRDSCADRPCQNATENADGFLAIHAGRALLTRQATAGG
ncbi:hypothetical protein T484DRAFT_1878615, partial [Baffinella frigidus]